MDCGYSCSFRVAVWLDASRLLLAGTADEVDEAPFDRVHPAVSIFDLQNRRTRLYDAPPIDSKHAQTALGSERKLWQSLYPWLRAEDPE